MKTLYLDCQSGISGDMTLAALIDLGADLDYISNQLRTLPIDPFTMDVKTVNKKGIAAKELLLDFHVNHDSLHIHHHDSRGHHRRASALLDFIHQSELPPMVKSRSSSVFKAIAEAEGKIHGIDPRDVHFHEVGAMDSMIDVIGVCLALEALNINRIIASPVPVGHGKVMMAHGLYPVPAPATAELLKGIPLMSFDVAGELTTPTGAGFLKALVDEFGQIPSLTIENIGYGAGKKDFDHPNVLRAFLFTESEKTENGRSCVTILECQVDDMTGEQLGFVMEKLFESGALDVYFTPVIMKKNRPGTLLTVLTDQENQKLLEDIMLRETSTFGIRISEWTRRTLSRKFKKVASPYGEIKVKIGYEGDTIYQISPEYEEVKKAANCHHVPFSKVYMSIRNELINNVD
ncbi:nickel pincer cofactor biosynthesis protein LarC [Scopulibacillus cellulosilyticus]|uniref:Pyridinium-3,5-bisthiocarboxylic acid mononucleotide nickel insertion protein n=1 Tax=Scopulibacillus cellulosilyticus TaxID=2665665 RepID=A0ABW2PSB5_9BACL